MRKFKIEDAGSAISVSRNEAQYFLAIVALFCGLGIGSTLKFKELSFGNAVGTAIVAYAFVHFAFYLTLRARSLTLNMLQRRYEFYEFTIFGPRRWIGSFEEVQGVGIETKRPANGTEPKAITFSHVCSLIVGGKKLAFYCSATRQDAREFAHKFSDILGSKVIDRSESLEGNYGGSGGSHGG